MIGVDVRSCFRERLQLLLHQRNMTQKQLAERAEITEAAISKYVSGERMPSMPLLARIVQALDTSADFLLGIENSLNDKKQKTEKRIFKWKTRK